MFERIHEYINKGGFLRRILATIGILAIIVFFGGTGLFMTALIYDAIESSTRSDVLPLLSFLLLGPVLTVGLPWFILSATFNAPKKVVSESEEYNSYGYQFSWEKVEKFGETSHFGKIFGEKKTKEMLSKEIFHPYTFQSGLEAHSLQISESGRWFSILDGYLPVDFICGYNKQKSELYTIDGTTIKLPAVKSHLVGTELERFFEERGDYFKEIPKDSYFTFSRHYSKSGSDFAKDNWGLIRYKWEKKLYRDKNTDFRVLSDNGMISRDIFERVLSDNEARQIKNAIKKDKVDLKRYLRFDDYRNEYSVCNVIDLLKLLGSPKNLEGCDFLFACLGNIDEPYFRMAVDMLKTFPRDMREEKIEEYAEAAHRKGDVKKFGGLLYLAKELEYDIKYVEKMKAEEEARKEKMVEEAKEVARGQVMQMFR